MHACYYTRQEDTSGKGHLFTRSDIACTSICKRYILQAREPWCVVLIVHIIGTARFTDCYKVRILYVGKVWCILVKRN